MELAEQLLSKLSQIAPAPYDTFPDIELYMDQVLEYLSRIPVSLRQDDKLTAAMINNYTKDGLLPRANGKRYSQEHLAHLILISRLKQVLSVKDTGALLQSNKTNGSEKDVYAQFCNAVESVNQNLMQSIETYGNHIATIAMRLAVESYICKIACEFLIDQGKAPQEHTK